MKLLDFNRTVEFKKKKGVLGYFQTLYHSFFDLILLNFCFVLTSLPIVTIGASYSSLIKVCKNFVLDENVYPIKMYFSSFKKMLIKQSIFGLIFGFLIFIICFSFVFYYNLGRISVFFLLLAVICLAVLLLVIMMICYFFPLSIESQQKFTILIKQSFIKVFQNIKRSFAFVFTVFVVIGLLGAFFPYSLPLVAVFPAVLIALASCVCFYE